MIARYQRYEVTQRGMVLITALLLLIVVTILAIGMFRSFGLDEKIAGNVREKQRAASAAETAEQFAEYWLTTSTNTSAIACTGVVASSVGQVCTNPLTSVTAVANGYFQNGGANIGVTYIPTAASAMNVATSGGVGTYYYSPAFYITYLGASANGQQTFYQIDAVGYGGTADSAAVVEATYVLQQAVQNLGAGQ